MCQGWHGPSLCRPPGYRGPPGSECTPDRLPSPLPYPLVMASIRPLPVALRRWSPFVEGVRFCIRPVLSISPLPPHASGSSLPPWARAASFVSLSLSPLCVLPVSSAAPTVRSGARRWHTSPYIDRTCRCERPCITRIARSCTSTWSRIFSRRQLQDKLIVLVPWCGPPALSPPPSHLFPPRS